MQQWTETKRKHSQAIEDGQLESAYQAGEISIHELIAHYNTRREEVERNSPEWRETSDRYFDLVDKRDADYIDEQSMMIVDRIERGQASYQELLDFYQGMASKVRSSSPLAAQIKRQITNIRQIVDSVGASGGGGGGGRGGRSGGSRGGGGGGAEATELGTAIQRANDLITERYRLGNVFVPTGEAIVQSVFDLFDVEGSKTAILDAMEADSRYIEQMMSEWRDNPNTSNLRTANGQVIKNTPENRWAIYNQAIAGYDFRVELMNATGDYDGAAVVAAAKGDFVDKIMQYDNEQSVRDVWDKRREFFYQDLNIAATAPDPSTAFRTYQKAALSLNRAANKYLSQNNEAVPELQFDEFLVEEMEYSKGLSELVQRAKDMTPEEILTYGSMLLDDRPESFYLTSEQISEVVGNIEGPTGSGLAGAAAAKAGYQSNLSLRRGEFTDIEPYVYVARPGESMPRLVKKSMVAEYLGLDTDDWMRAVRPFAERVGQYGVAEIVYRPMEAYEVPKWYQTKGGNWVSYEQYKKVGRDPQAIAEKGWTFTEIPEFVGWQTVTDGGGITWYVDPADGQMYQKMPFRGGITGEFDIYDLIDSSGKLRIERLQGAEGFVMGIGYGVSNRTAQDLAMRAAISDEIDMDLYHSRDVGSGYVNPDPMPIDNLEGMYWSPADASVRELERRRGVRPDQNMFEYNSRKRKEHAIEVAKRQELQRVARVREWFETSDIRTARRTGVASAAVEDSITRGAREAGISLGGRKSNAQIGAAQGAAIVQVRKFEAPTAPEKKTAPIKLTEIRPPVVLSDPKITTPLPSTVNTEPQDKPAYAKSPVKYPTRRATRKPRAGAGGSSRLM